jgi:hypothetical protein
VEAPARVKLQKAFPCSARRQRILSELLHCRQTAETLEDNVWEKGDIVCARNLGKEGRVI